MGPNGFVLPSPLQLCKYTLFKGILNVSLNSINLCFTLFFFEIACGPPEEGFAECCFEDEPMFYKITVIDHEADDEMVSK